MVAPHGSALGPFDRVRNAVAGALAATVLPFVAMFGWSAWDCYVLGHLDDKFGRDGSFLLGSLMLTATTCAVMVGVAFIDLTLAERIARLPQRVALGSALGAGVLTYLLLAMRAVQPLFELASKAVHSDSVVWIFAFLISAVAALCRWASFIAAQKFVRMGG